MNTFGRKAVLWFASALMVVVVAAPAAAQNAPGVEVGVGYQYFRLTGEDDLGFPVGFNFDVAFPIMDQIGIVGEVGWARGSDEIFLVDGSYSATSFGGGVRWTGQYSESFDPFAQVILGAQRTAYDVEFLGEDLDSDSSTDFMLQLGGGVNVKVAPNWGVVGQIDYRRIFYEGEGSNGFRFVIGARFSVR